MFGLKKNDLIGMIITAVVGFSSGVFLYVIHFSKLAEPDPVAEQEDVLEFSVIGEVYGGCTDACPRFRVENNGAYIYRFTRDRLEGELVREGFIPLSIKRSLQTVAKPADLLTQSEGSLRSDCPSSSGGVDFRYRVTVEGIDYTLDSCTTAVDMSADLWLALNSTWQYLKTVE